MNLDLHDKNDSRDDLLRHKSIQTGHLEPHTTVRTFERPVECFLRDVLNQFFTCQTSSDFPLSLGSILLAFDPSLGFYKSLPNYIERPRHRITSHYASPVPILHRLSSSASA